MSEKSNCKICGENLTTDAKFCSNCGNSNGVQKKNHWMAVHTWVSEEARLERIQLAPPTDRQFFEFYTTENAECVQHWAGKSDFFTAIG